MLVELSCDKFVEDGRVRPVIHFNPGLNVVLGDDAATNSIGKSTVLMILDYAFGGDDYVTKVVDVQRNVGHHVIKFAFCFSGNFYYFSRDTKSSMMVCECDSSYNKRHDIPISEYRDFLKEKYEITQEDLSFRETVSRFSRIYQRDNLDEKNPVSQRKGECHKDGVDYLLKLFGYYAVLKGRQSELDDAEAKLKAYCKAAKYRLLPVVSTKTEYKKLEARAVALESEQRDFSDPEALKKRSINELSRIADIKKRLQILRGSFSREDTKQGRIEVGLSSAPIEFCEDFTALKEFFPSVDLKKVADIEGFHRQLSSILHEELESELEKTKKVKEILRQEMSTLESELESYDVPSGISTKLLQSYAEKAEEVSRIREQQRNYNLKHELRENRNVIRDQLNEQRKGCLSKLQGDLSAEMIRLNDQIYNGQRKAPVLSLRSDGYDFTTPDDTGTGTAYKSLIVYDLAVLRLSNLPFLIHDSVLLKNIGDAPIARIIDLYREANKQVFIAIDKSNSYSAETAQKLQDATVLRLSSGSKALFGRFWGEVRFS